MKRITITGSVGFGDYNYLSKRLDDLLNQEKDLEVLCGTEEGTDQLVQKYCKQNKIPFRSFKTEHSAYQQAAFFIRNKHMLFESSSCILFWDGSSKGTRIMIDLAKKMGVPTHVEGVNNKAIKSADEELQTGSGLKI